MATKATPMGARPVDSLGSKGSYTGSVRHIPIVTTYNTNIFTGDFVAMVGGGTIERVTVTTSVPTGYVGIFMGCAYTDPTTKQFTPASIWPANNAATDAVAYVADDPFLIFIMQGDEAITAAKLGLNISAVNTVGSTDIGRSKNALDGGSAATTNTLPFRILEFVESGGNTLGDAFTECFVTLLAGKHRYLTIAGI